MHEEGYYFDNISIYSGKNSTFFRVIRSKGLSVEARKVGLEVNTEKTEYMCVNVCEDADLMSLYGKRINKVSDFKYLGSKVSSTKNDLAHR